MKLRLPQAKGWTHDRTSKSQVGAAASARVFLSWTGQGTGQTCGCHTGAALELGPVSTAARSDGQMMLSEGE